MYGVVQKSCQKERYSMRQRQRTPQTPFYNGANSGLVGVFLIRNKRENIRLSKKITSLTEDYKYYLINYSMEICPAL